jgi:hypothetical protein
VHNSIGEVGGPTRIIKYQRLREGCADEHIGA